MISLVSYCTLQDVKNRLNIEDTSEDVELTDLIEQAQEDVDDELRPYTTVPLTSVPTRIKHATADLAAGLYQVRRHPEQKPLYDLALDRLRVYIKSKYASGTFKVVQA